MRIVHRKHPDMQRRYPAASCTRCAGELYEGEECWQLGGHVLCRECAVQWLLEEAACRRKRVGRWIR